ncbi:PIN domain-containing protein [Candidatus Woesearchaeota archaeon]|nr:PIN domain-containing protein [Candidatus Woesearchaeota archaeon]
MGQAINYFFDTYALHEIEEGNDNYRTYAEDVGIVTTKLNLMELYYSYYVEKGLEAAEKSFSDFRDFCIDIEDATIKEAVILRARFKSANRKNNVSYVDCLGYVLAGKLKIKFLTGDREFEGLENVEFVK